MADATGWPLGWRVLSQVVAGVGIARQQSGQQLGAAWLVSEDEMLTSLSFLKGIGYEVRSHNTNPQIEEGDYLIPYAFPTLNPRSIQRRGRL